MIASLRKSSTTLSITPNPKGFTLTELLIAASLTTIAIGIGGLAMANMITSSKTNASQTERRVELNRSLDFISTEAKQASKINSAVAPAEFSTSQSSTEIDKTTVKEILRLTIPGLSQPIVYYTATPATTNKVWRGPVVLYRWGPPFDGNGAYTNITTTSSWTHLPLVDAVDSTAPTATCSTGWTASPSTGAAGFYACIDANNRIAQLYNKGRVTKVLGQTSSYLAEAKVFARSTTSNTSLPFIINSDNTVSTPALASTSFEVLGSAIQCGAGGTPMKTAFTVNYQVGGTGTKSSTAPTVVDPAGTLPSLPLDNQPAGTKFDFTAYIPTKATNPKNTCNAQNIAGTGGFNSITDPSQVRILKQGDPVPTTAGFDGSKSTKDIVGSYIDSSNKINLPHPTTQYIVLFELGATDITSTAFDIQDLVLLVTVTPS
jgi:Tfp pilus assembly protein FimT